MKWTRSPKSNQSNEEKARDDNVRDGVNGSVTSFLVQLYHWRCLTKGDIFFFDICIWSISAYFILGAEIQILSDYGEHRLSQPHSHSEMGFGTKSPVSEMCGSMTRTNIRVKNMYFTS